MPLLEQVLETYPGKVKVAFKHYPIRSHKFAFQAATAATAAAGYGKFWELHDRLFQNYNSLSNEKIIQIAREVGLNEKELQEKMKDPAVLEQIRKDITDANDAGVRGTPTLFINGRMLKERSLEGFKQIIDRELAKKK